ncbi:MAG TPA: DNA mismatch repair endonuclease MutL [Dehalococcoidia bacterium]|nr:DNA mismatch repair endonuclease MutL [Dehalococcoidia bacterium]
MAIRILPADLAAQIAAGEVVERPASVVKELLENAIDAGAHSIAVEVLNGGLDLIRVSDDGCGIAPEEIEVAFARHATSKLASAEDLFRIATLGFRGEALPSIAAAGDVEVYSRVPGSESATYARIESGRLVETGLRGAPAGTSFAVSKLFERQPARRKFLRSPAGEANQISTVVSHYALAYPEIRFNLRLNGRTSLQTDGSGRLEDAVVAVYGAEVAAALLQVESTSGPVEVRGVVIAPHVSRSNRGYISIFINRRWIQSRRLTYAIEEAYQGLLMVGRYPIAVLDIRLPPDEVDVNVHPTKAEVRLRDESAVFGAIQRAVRPALLRQAPVPAVEGLGESLHLEPLPLTPSLWQTQSSQPPTRGEVPAPAIPTPTQALPVLRVIGQYGNLYIISEGPEGMYLIDQHAAHERILYDELSAKRAAARPEVQGLLEPLTVELAPPQDAAVQQDLEALRDHGFEIEPFGPRCYLLRTIPAVLRDADPRAGFLAVVDEMLESESYPVDRVAMSLACHAAVRAGKALTMEEMRELVQQLERTTVPNTCPHGRPTMVQLSADSLAREFGRR